MSPDARQLDFNGIQLPDIIFEVDKTQSYDDLFSRPDIYFSFPGVKAVVLVKLVNSTVGDLKIDQMVAVIYRRDGNGDVGRRVALVGECIHK
jgi:hypothetical protein